MANLECPHCAQVLSISEFEDNICPGCGKDPRQMPKRVNRGTPAPKQKWVTGYDPSVIQSFASQLYAEADSLVIKTMAIYGISGGMLAYGISQVPALNGIWGALVIGSGCFGAFMGYLNAQPKAFSMRLQAQVARCQLQIELNTRSE